MYCNFLDHRLGLSLAASPSERQSLTVLSTFIAIHSRRCYPNTIPSVSTRVGTSWTSTSTLLRRLCCVSVNRRKHAIAQVCPVYSPRLRVCLTVATPSDITVCKAKSWLSHFIERQRRTNPTQSVFPVLTSFSSSSSPTTFTPSSRALSSFDPASLPATT
jgi:hypothetical protein